MSLWQYPLYDLEGDVLFLDLDLVITGDLDRFFDFKPGFYCVIENWTQKGKKLETQVVLDFPLVNIIQYSKNFKKTLRNIGKNITLNKFI